MPRRLALSLIVAWLAWTSQVLAQGQLPNGYPVGQYRGPFYQDGAPVYYHQNPTWEQELVPPVAGDYDWDAAADLAFNSTLGQAWMRTEYLYWQYQDPSSEHVGSATLATSPFAAIDRITGARAENGTLVSQAPLDNLGVSGLRLTMGVPTQWFGFEASVFGMLQSKSSLTQDPFVDTANLSTPTIPVIPVTRAGVMTGLDFIPFDDGMTVLYRGDLQGTDAKLVFSPLTPNVPVQFSPILGFNYLHYTNRMTVTGTDTATLTNHLIDSNANNHIFGPELGMRIESSSGWFTLGFEPKLTFGINRILNRVITQQIYDPTEANRLIDGTQTRFSPILDLTTHARVKLSENLQLTLGYQFMFMTNVSLSERNIVWDSPALITAPSRVRLDMHRRDFWVQGLNVGLQFQF